MKIIIGGLLTGFILFIGFSIMNYRGYIPLGEAFNRFFSMVGLILFFISGFFLISYRTLKY
jgi:hypothetical protein